MMRHYLAIKYEVSAEGQVDLGPALGFRRKDTWYHWHGPSRMGWPRRVEIVADYGMVDSADDNALDALEIRFAQEFPWLSGLVAGGGWLSPHGVFYPCKGWEHNTSAFMIALAVYGTASPGVEGYGTVDRLERLGWRKLYDEFLVVDNYCPLTQAQVDTLGELLMFGGQKDSLLESIRVALEREEN